MNVDDITVLDPVYSTWIERKNFSCQDSPTPVLEIRYNTIQYNTIQYNTIRRAIKHLTCYYNYHKTKTAFTIPSSNYAIINFFLY